MRVREAREGMRRQTALLEKTKKDLDDARGKADDAQRGAITMFNEQKRYELNIQRL